jgi:hypothetical protein
MSVRARHAVNARKRIRQDEGPVRVAEKVLTDGIELHGVVDVQFAR